MILENEIVLGGTTAPAAYQIERSLRFNSADSAYLNWTPPQAGNRRTYTISTWVKRSAIASGTYYGIFTAGAASGGNNGLFFDTAAGALYFTATDGITDILISSALYRDPSAWYHVVVAVDTTQATAANRVKMYVNGVQLTAFSSSTYPAQNSEATYINTVNTHRIGAHTNAGYYFSGYITEVNFIDGQALTPSDFGETSSSTGVWIPKAYTGSYGQNGFYLPFNDNSAPVNLGRNRQTLTADPYYPYTTLLLNGNQPAGVTDVNNIVFKDSSTNTFPVNRTGDVKQGTFSPFSQTGWSNYFNGSSDYLNYATGQNIANFGTSDFTIEAWINPSAVQIGSTSGFQIITSPQNGTNVTFYLQFYNSQLQFGVQGSAAVIAQTWVPTVGQWVHVAVCRSGTNLRAFINGTQLGTTVTNSSNFVDGVVQIAYGGAGYLNGYVSNVRINKSALYTANFTPSTSPLAADANTVLLTCQSNRFVDNASKTVTTSGTPSVQAFSPFAPTAAYSAATHGGSGYWDGDTDLLSVSSSTEFNLGTNDFTIEGWMYTGGTRGGTDDAMITNWTGTWAANFWSVHNHHATQNNKISFWVYNISSSAAIMVSTTNPNSNQWVHFAIVRSGSSFAMFVNGKREATYTSSTALNSAAAPIYIGGPVTSNEYLGYMSNVRILNGTAAYSPGDANITVPTAPFTNSSNPNTKLLLNFTNAGVIDSTGKAVISTLGNAQISTTQSKWGGASMYFDGAGDSVYVEPSQLTSFGTADFTIEGWVRINAFTQTSGIVCNNWTSSTWAANFWSLHSDHPNQNEKFSFFVYNIDSVNALMASSTTIAANTWYHVAVTRVGSTFRLFVNGVQEATYTSATSIDGGTLKPIYVGGGPSADQASNSYIDDLRISKFARYTGNFTVPQAQFAYNQADINVKQWVPASTFSVTAGVGNDSLVDSPTNYGTDTGAGGEVRGNYATLNPLRATATLANGNLQFTGPTSGGAQGTFATMGVTSGKWYFEVTPTTIAGTYYPSIGISTNESELPTAQPGVAAGGYMYMANGQKFVNNALSNYGASYAANDVIGVALDMDAGTITFYKNGVSQGQAYTGVTGTATPVLGNTGAATPSAGYINFGQRPFAYTAPSGFKALCTQNLPTPAIGASASTLASKNMNVVTYTGDGNATQSITGVGFQPDLQWIKMRGGTAWHMVSDAVRGVNINIFPNDTGAEITNNANGYTSAFSSDGFTVAKGSTSADNTNKASTTYVGWSWKANGAGSSNTAGTLSSTVSVNTAAGISIVAFAVPSGTSNYTVGHGLGVAPAMIITKGRGSADNWVTFHKSVCTNVDTLLRLNTTGAAGTLTNVWGSSLPDSSVFGIKVGSTLVASQNAIAYCFAEVEGFSKFGKYTGNANADGPFVYCGFRPRFIMVKRTDAIDSWMIYDTVRNSYNIANLALYPNASTTETTETNNPFDILSNGFKVRGSGTTTNASSGTYIFAAFAEAPFNYARAR